MPAANNETELHQLVRDQLAASASYRYNIAIKHCIAVCYASKKQWRAIQHRNGRPEVARDYRTPQDRAIRVTNDKISRLLRQNAAATSPVLLDPEWRTPRNNTDQGVWSTCAALERLSGAIAEHSSLADAAGDANYRRRGGGTQVLGFHLTGLANNDARIRPFIADPFTLILDPANQAPKLEDHEVVIIEEVWTEKRIRETLGDAVKHHEFLELRELCPMQASVHDYTHALQYQRFRRDSRTKGARVFFVFMRGRGDRFEKMHAMVEVGKGNDRSPAEMISINGSDENPYGDNGLPLFLMHANRSMDSMWSTGDVAEIKEDQDRLNLAETFLMRLMNNSSAYKLLVDRRYFEGSPTDDEIRRKITNAAWEILPGAPNGRLGVEAPKVLQTPPLAHGLEAYGDRIENAMETAVHRSSAHRGVVKSHVPDATMQRVMDAVEQPLDESVQRDLKGYAQLIRVMTATAAKYIDSPSMKLVAKRYGITDDDRAVLRKLDHTNLVGTCRLRQSAVLQRSTASKRQELAFALVQGAINPAEYRLAMVRDLDTPVAEVDQQAADYARRSIDAVLAGGEYVPIPLGDTPGQIVVMILQAAAMGRDAGDHGAQRLIAAIESQAAKNLEFFLSTDPATVLAQQQAAEAADAEALAQAAEEQNATDPGEGSLVVGAAGGAPISPPALAV